MSFVFNRKLKDMISVYGRGQGFINHIRNIYKTSEDAFLDINDKIRKLLNV